jgi:hypothetical protein
LPLPGVWWIAAESRGKSNERPHCARAGADVFVLSVLDVADGLVVVAAPAGALLGGWCRMGVVGADDGCRVIGREASAGVALVPSGGV